MVREMLARIRRMETENFAALLMQALIDVVQSINQEASIELNRKSSRSRRRLGLRPRPRRSRCLRLWLGSVYTKNILTRKEHYLDPAQRARTVTRLRLAPVAHIDRD